MNVCLFSDNAISIEIEKLNTHNKSYNISLIAEVEEETAREESNCDDDGDDCTKIFINESKIEYHRIYIWIEYTTTIIEGNGWQLQLIVQHFGPMNPHNPVYNL